MRIAIIGSGGRENALAWRLHRSPSCSALAALKPNPGWPMGTEILQEAPLLDALHTWQAELVVVGPEVPLAEGIADACAERGILCFGPTKAAAMLETSKVFAKQIMRSAGIPTADSVTVRSVEEGLARCRKGKVVIKASGLAAGKGVYVCPTPEQAIAALNEVFERFGAAAEEVLLEDLLDGPEVSIFALSDGRRTVPLLSAQDHKRLLDGDRGENTGGMGAIAPCPLVSSAEVAALVRQIHQPVVDALAAKGTPFRGVLYAGLMLTSEGPKVLEFNVRFGDPECQPLMLLWKDDPVPWLAGCARGDLPAGAPLFSDRSAATIVLASAGYPRSSQVGVAIPRLPDLKDMVVFHSATRIVNGALQTNGGRVLGVTATGETLAEALDLAYHAATSCRFDGSQLRKDIGARYR